MLPVWNRLERALRIFAMGTAAMGAFVLLAFQLHWIKSSAEYRVSSWYGVDSGKRYYRSTEYTDEKTCREHIASGENCRSGNDMVARELAEQDVRIAIRNQ